MFNRLKGFTRAFWTANIVELLERGAYYGVFIVITLYLSRILGFTDVEAGLISGVFSGGLYLLPTFTGALADKIGFKNSLLIAFALLSLGYFGLGILPTALESIGLVDYSGDITFTGLLESSQRWAIVPIMIIIMIGGSFIKSVITGTVAKETTEENRAQGFSIFYMMVNIGAFSGKTIVKPLRDSMGDMGFVYINYFSTAMTLIALIMIIFFYKSSKHQGEGKTFKEIWSALIKVLFNGRLITLIIIITGFWMVQHQLYATMPKYVLRMAGEGASPSWYANVNPLIVVLTVTFVTRMMASKTPLFSMTVGMFIMPLSAIAMASGISPSKKTGVTQVFVLPMLKPFSTKPFCRALTFSHNFSRSSGMVLIMSSLFKAPFTIAIGNDLAKICDLILYFKCWMISLSEATKAPILAKLLAKVAK